LIDFYCFSNVHYCQFSSDIIASVIHYSVSCSSFEELTTVQNFRKCLCLLFS
jgi:hypothetical protein